MENHRAFWSAVSAALRAGHGGVLLCVVESIGSSPGRAGFKAFVSGDGGLHGSIGGGSMEQKLVMLARSLMGRPDRFPFVKRQVHQAGLGQDRSGMICSGEQTVAFLHLQAADGPMLTALIHQLDNGAHTTLELGPAGLSLAPGIPLERTVFSQASDTDWHYREPLDAWPRIAIVGGGHVGLALSRTMHQLGFHIHLLDDREGLNTIEANVHAHRVTIIDYDRIGEVLVDDPQLFVVLASFGYRTDDQVLRRILRKRFRYLGMLGSAAKVETLFAALRADGFTEAEIARVHAPIGIPIHSRTPEEIAISIAAEIIREKNA